MSTKGQEMPEGKIKGDNAHDTTYWSSALSSISIWNSSKPANAPPEKENTEAAEAAKSKASTDHRTTPFHGPSLRSYPKECPRLKVQWFHAIDVPKRTAVPHSGETAAATDSITQPKPKKFSAFSAQDSRRIEAKYQSLLEADEDRRSGTAPAGNEAEKPPSSSSANFDTHVPVNEDFLFDVSIKERELGPVYWLGPIYEVRRGTWFYQDGSNLRPCDENLAAQLEEGYIKMKAWIGLEKQGKAKPATASGKVLGEGMATETSSGGAVESEPKPHKLKSHRLFGAYMNNTVTYEDENTAWLVSDGVLSWVATSAYERFAGGGHMSGVKLTRGYSDQTKAKEKDTTNKQKASSKNATGKAPPSMKQNPDKGPKANSKSTEKALLRRRLSTIMDSEDRRTAKSDDDVLKLNEEEMRHDYLTQSGESQNRDIEHLVLVTHGIGQRLSLRTQSINFIHDVNVLRKTLKAVYASSPDLRSINADEEGGPGNCRVQVLPVCWRDKVEFPRGRRTKATNDETDVAEALDEEDPYPTLEDITIEGVAFARSLISDLALDVLLYQSSYRAEIAQAVIEESNRIVALFRQRNPGFSGKIHVVGHSLGSAILFDILCHENRQRRRESMPNPLRVLPNRGPAQTERKNTLDFDVDDFYCLGSPIGLFQMLTGRTIAARQPERSVSKVGLTRAVDSDSIDDGYAADPKPETGVSRPDARQLFNIFYPSDPISYRIEPLIASSMAKVKPHNLPYTKKSLFGVVGPQGLTDIGTKVGQSVSGLFASLSTGISSNLLPASLRISNEAQLMMKEGLAEEALGDAMTEKAEEKTSVPDVSATPTSDEDEQLLVDQTSRFATLYSRFHMNDERTAESTLSLDADGKDRKINKERIAQRKVWALNQNGRVDFSIQEGALDFNPISTIASHIGYWGEEDVSHFMLSQVLSRVEKKQDWMQ